MRLILPALIGAILLVTPGRTDAAGRRRAAGPSKQLQTAAMGRAMYPRYYHSIHAREYQRIGVPTGDIGLRGNGITWTPW
jgi:hypothetical protein